MFKIQSLLAQGAEAKIYNGIWDEEEECIIKERLSKKYRHPELDRKLNRKRINQESRCMVKASERAQIRVPRLIKVQDNFIVMELIKGDSLKVHIEEKREKLAPLIGKMLAKLHSANIIHGDLTTSNMMLTSEEKELVLIDFGLSFVSTLAEDKAVDLYVLERAIQSTHPDIGDDIFKKIIEEYGIGVENSKTILERFESVQKRGRKRDMSG